MWWKILCVMSYREYKWGLKYRCILALSFLLITLLCHTMSSVVFCILLLRLLLVIYYLRLFSSLSRYKLMLTLDSASSIALEIEAGHLFHHALVLLFSCLRLYLPIFSSCLMLTMSSFWDFFFLSVSREQALMRNTEWNCIPRRFLSVSIWEGSAYWEKKTLEN